jgi:ketosteroid isomerase-like protein
MATDVTEAVVQRYLDAFTNRDAERLEELLAQEFVGHLNDHDEDREEFKRAMTRFADVRLGVKELLVGPERAAFVHSFTVTFAQSFERAPGRTMDVDAMTFLRTRDGKVAELWMTWDSHTSMGQLGLLGVEHVHHPAAG